MKIFLDKEGIKPETEGFRAPPEDGSEYIETRPFVEMPDDTDLSTMIVDGGVLREMTPSEITKSQLPPVPQSVSMRQARAALITEGLIGLVQPAIDALTEPDKSLANNEWEYSQTVDRDRPLVALLGSALSLDDDALDDLFRLASTL